MRSNRGYVLDGRNEYYDMIFGLWSGEYRNLWEHDELYKMGQFPDSNRGGVGLSHEKMTTKYVVSSFT